MTKAKEETTESTTKTEAEKIWHEIKDKQIQMFALPDQQVHMHCKPVKIEPSKLYLQINATSTFPALEAALGPKFSIERFDKYLTVSRVK